MTLLDSHAAVLVCFLVQEQIVEADSETMSLQVDGEDASKRSQKLSSFL